MAAGARPTGRHPGVKNVPPRAPVRITSRANRRCEITAQGRQCPTRGGIDDWRRFHAVDLSVQRRTSFTTHVTMAPDAERAEASLPATGGMMMAAWTAS